MSDRCFFSLKFRPQQQALLHACQGHELGSDAKWHPAENLHLTLVFLGQQSLVAQQQLWQHSLALFRQFSPFELCFDQLNQFSQARVLYLGVSQPPETLTLLQRQLQLLALPFLDAPVQEPFVPHVTLARKFHSDSKFPLPVSPLNLRCSELALYHSVSAAQGVSYVPVQTYTLVSKG